MKNEIKTKAIVLRNFLEKDNDIMFNPFTERFKCENREYLVLTENEANNEAKDSIKETLYTFNTGFLAKQTGLNEEIYNILSQQGKESNKIISMLIESTIGLNLFMENTIDLDGISHFVPSYDEQEHEQVYDDSIYYIYRIS